MCVFVCSSGLVPCTSWLGVRCRGVCSGLGCSRAPPLLAGLLGRVCVCLCAPLVPRHSWLGCAVWACVLGSGFGCAPLPLVGVSGCVCVRACAPIASRHYWGAACGVGVCGCCCVWGLPPPLPFCFFLGGGGASWRGVSCLCGVGRWLSRSWVSRSPSFLPLLFRLRLRVFFFPSPPNRGVCLRVRVVPSSGGSLLLVWRCRFWLAGPAVPLWRVPSSVPSGWGVWPPLVVWVGGFVAVGLSRAPPPWFFFWGGSACSSLCLPWAGVRTGWHSVWSSGWLLVLALCQALHWPHGSAGLCTRLARRPFLPG